MSTPVYQTLLELFEPYNSSLLVEEVEEVKAYYLTLILILAVSSFVFTHSFLGDFEAN